MSPRPVQCVTLALALAVCASAHAIPLSNPSFETPASGNPDGWGVIGNVDAEDVSTDVAHSGNQSLKFDAIVLNQTAQLFTVTDAATGDATTRVTWSVEAYKPAGDPITNHFLVLAIEFKAFNTPGDPGSGDFTVSYFEEVFETNNLPADAWTTQAMTRTATGAWERLLLHVKLVGLEASSSGTLYIDDASAVVPEPATLGLALAGAACVVLRRRKAGC